MYFMVKGLQPSFSQSHVFHFSWQSKTKDSIFNSSEKILTLVVLLAHNKI